MSSAIDEHQENQNPNKRGGESQRGEEHKNQETKKKGVQDEGYIYIYIYTYSNGEFKSVS